MSESRHNRTPAPVTHAVLPDDPTVEEIRDIRRRLWESAGRDIHRYIRETHDAVKRLKSDGQALDAPR